MKKLRQRHGERMSSTNDKKEKRELWSIRWKGRDKQLNKEGKKCMINKKQNDGINYEKVEGEWWN